MIVNIYIPKKLAILALIMMSSILSATTTRKLTAEDILEPVLYNDNERLPDDCVYPKIPIAPVYKDPPQCIIDNIIYNQEGLVYNEIVRQINNKNEGAHLEDLDEVGKSGVYSQPWLQSRFQQSDNGVEIQTESRLILPHYEYNIVYFDLVINTYNKDKDEALQDNQEARGKLLKLILDQGLTYQIIKEYEVTCHWISYKYCFGYWRIQKIIKLKVYWLYNNLKGISI